MAAAFASELGYKGYNDYGYNHGYNNHYDLGHHGYNNYGYNSYGYNSYGYDSHRLHRRSPTVFLPPFIATKGLLALAKVPFPIGK